MNTSDGTSETKRYLLEVLTDKISRPFHLDAKSFTFDLLDRHKLTVLSEDYFESLSEEEISYRKANLLRIAVKQLKLSQCLSDILTCFLELGIEAIPLKGPILAFRLFGDIGKRHSGDLDILIKKHQLRLALDALRDLGYIQVSPKQSISDQQLNHFFKFSKEVTVSHPQIGLHVELHVGLYNRGLLSRRSGERLLSDTRVSQFNKVPIQEMCNNNLFIYLSYHGAFHQYYRLFWLRDIDQAIRVLDLNHEEILEKSADLGIDRFVALSVALSNKLFDTPIPQAYSAYLHTHRKVLNRLLRVCESRYCGPEKPTFMQKIARHYYLFLLKPSIAYLVNIVPNILNRWYIRRFLGGH